VRDSEANNWGFGTDDQVSLVAGKMYGERVQALREEVAKYDIQSERLRKTFAAARAEADRSAAILLFALAEDIMLHGLKQHLDGEVQGGWSEVSSGNGVLATANDRITLLALLNWIHPAVYADLRILKAIRNRFAHHPDVIGFDEAKTRSYISSLSQQEKAPLAAMESADGPRSPRHLYLMCAASVVMRLVYNLAVAPAARRAQVAPGHVEGGDWNATPENIRELHRVLAEHMIAVAAEGTG